MNYTQDDNGNWEEATPILVQGIVAKTEFWLRDKGFHSLANRLAAWDERSLGK